MENSQRGSTTLLIILGIILIIVAGAYYFSMQKNSGSQVSNSATTTTQTQTTPNSIAGWQTYTDPVLKISFQYPPGWGVMQNQNGVVSGYADQTSDVVTFSTYYTPPATQSVFISKADCQSVIQTHPGKITNCKSGGGVSIYIVAGAEQQVTDAFNKMVGSITPFSQSASPTPSSGSSGKITVAGMQQYTDSKFGFSFWYPSNWTVQSTSVQSYISLAGGTVGNIIEVGPAQYPGGGISGVGIIEFTSSGKSITDNSSAGPAGNGSVSLKYFFDTNTHTWMAQDTDDYNKTTTYPANVSLNTMGGLHMLGGNARFDDDVIIPLSAEHFLVVYAIDAGGTPEKYLAHTIVALDPSVATPVSAVQQIQTIQAEKNEYIQISTNVQSPETYTDSTYSFKLTYSSDFAPVSALTPQQKTQVASYMGACPLSTYSHDPNVIGFCYVGGKTSDGFESAALVITPDASLSQQTCMQSKLNEGGPQAPQTTVAINGVTFYENKLAEAGLGHYQSIDSYRTYYNGVCYTADLKIDSDIGTSEQGLSADFSNMMLSNLKSVFSSFQFTK